MFDNGWEEDLDVRDKLDKLDKVDDTGREHDAAEGESCEDSEKYFELELESEEIESGERNRGEEDEDDDGDDEEGDGECTIIIESE